MLLDVPLPSRSAVQLLARIRNEYTHGRLPVLVVTTSARADAKLLAAADDVVFQPIGAAELRLRITNAVSADRSPGAAPRPEVPEVLRLPDAALHDSKSGRIDAKRIAEYLDVPLKAVSSAIGREYKTVFKTPAAPALQSALDPIARTLRALQRYFDRRQESLAWLNTPNPELDSGRPLDLLLHGQADVVADMLEGALAGVTT